MSTRTAAPLKYCLCALLAASTAFAADPALFDLVPAGTGVIIGINVEQISSTRFGQEIYRQVEVQSGRLSGGRGLELVRNLREVLIAAPANNQGNRGLLLMRGAFDENSLRSLADGAVESSFQGVRIYTRQQQKQQLAAAVLDPTLIAAGDPQSLRSAIARGSQPGSPDPVLAAKARELGASFDIWLVARVSLADLARQPQLGSFAGLEKSIQQMSAGLKFGPIVQISVDVATRTNKEAIAMADALRMLITLTASGQNAQQMKPVLDNLQLRAEANTVKLEIAVPEDQLIASMQAAGTRGSRATGSSEVVIQGSSSQDAGTATQPSQGGVGIITLPGPKSQ